MQTTVTSGDGPKHLLFTTLNDLYVLPAAFSVVPSGPPSITSVTPSLDANGNRVVVISGAGYFPPNTGTTTSVLFDGLPGVLEGTPKTGSLIVIPPPAQNGYTATVVALNSDGQSSLFLDPTPPTYTYGGVANAAPTASSLPSLSVKPSVLVAGNATTVNVFGTNTNFIAGQTTVGFGTSDVTVTQVTVLSPTHLSVQVMPNVSVPTSGVNVTTGLQVISEALGNRVTN